MNILIRADSSSTIGTGHIMRDLVLAKKRFYKDNVIFVSRNLPGNINFKIEESGYRLEVLNSNDLDELIVLTTKFNTDMVVIDNYGIDYEFERKLKEKNRSIKLMVFDDTCEKHYCDILLNHNIYANEKRYRGLVPKWCKLECGRKYMLIRDEFYEAKTIPKTKNEKFTVFLAMGGTDHKNIILKILDVLKKFDINVNAVTTTANKHLDNLKNFCQHSCWANLYINSNEVAKIMRQSDFAIVSASVILNEVFFMDMPFIAIQTADNQREMVGFLKKNGYPVLEDFDKNRLLKMLKGLKTV